MNNNDIQKYKWLNVYIVNGSLVLLFIVSFIYQYTVPDNFIYRHDVITTFGIFLACTLIATLFATLIGYSRFSKKHLFGFGIPLFLIIPFWYFLNIALTCTGKMCGIGETFIAYCIGIFTIFFLLFYISALLLQKKGVDFFRSLLIWNLIITITTLVFAITITCI